MYGSLVVLKSIWLLHRRWRNCRDHAISNSPAGVAVRLCGAYRHSFHAVSGILNRARGLDLLVVNFSSVI
jgi:hypothetical protein